MDCHRNWAANDERTFHAPEILRLMSGEAIISPAAKTATTPGYHIALASLGNLLRDRVHLAHWPLFIVAANCLSLFLLGFAVFRLFEQVFEDSLFSKMATLLVLLSPYTLTSGFWISTDNVATGFFLWALIGYLRFQKSSQKTWLAISVLAATACILVRQSYLPALAAPLLVNFWHHRRIEPGDLLFLLVPCCALLPFVLAWGGMVPQAFQVMHAIGFFGYVCFALFFWLGILTVLLLPAMNMAKIIESLSLTRMLIPAAAAVWLWSTMNFENGLDGNQFSGVAWALAHASQTDYVHRGINLLLLYLGMLSVTIGIGNVSSPRYATQLLCATFILLYLLSLSFQWRAFQRYYEVTALLMIFMLHADLLHRSWRPYVMPVLLLTCYLALFLFKSCSF